MYRNLNANIALLNYGHIYDIKINNYNYNINVKESEFKLKNINYNSLLYNNINNSQEK